MQTRKISIHQLIIFVMFVSAALITSLFIFHLRHAPEKNILEQDKGIIFPVARDIKPFELLTAENKPFTLNNFYHHWTLLIFGFTHCANVCPITLDLMKQIFANLEAHHPNLQVVFISIDPDRDTPASLTNYVKAFNAHFIGATGRIDELRKLQSELGIFAAHDLPPGSQIEHTSSILLINPQGKWVGLFNFGLKPNEFVQSFEKSVGHLS